MPTALATRLARCQRDVEEAAGRLCDLWGLAEVGGCATHEERREAERALTRAVAALRLCRLDGH